VIRFADQTWLWLAAGITLALVLALALDFTRRRRLLERIGHAPQLRKMAGSVSPARRRIKAVLLVFGVACLALALARPQIEGQSQWRQRGIDLAIVMDFSKSMEAFDVHPSRIKRARRVADALIDGLAGDRVAVVAFAGGAVHYPLTTDYDAAKLLYHGLSTYDMAPGSDLTEAVRRSRCLLRPDLVADPECARQGGRGRGGDPLDEAEARREAERRVEVTDLGDRARAMVIITDGEQTEGDAAAEVQKAVEQGIEVYVIGVGTAQGAPIPEYDDEGEQRGWKVDETGANVITKLDEPGLKSLARLGGGDDHYWRIAGGQTNVKAIVDALGRLKEGEVQSRVVKRYNEAYQWLLFPGFMALIIEACISDRRRRRAAKQAEAGA
jgi:Ca-activated chloride channel family protein